MPKPNNLCEVSDYGSTSEDFELQAALQRRAKNKLLALYEDCLFSESRKIGTSETPTEWLLVVAHNPNPDKETLFKHYSTERFNEGMAKAVSGLDLNQIFKRVEKGGNQVLKDFSYDVNIAYNEPINLGVLDIDDAVYHGVIMNMNAGTNNYIVGGLFSYLLVNEVQIFVYKYKHYKNKQTMTDLLSESKYHVARLVHSN